MEEANLKKPCQKHFQTGGALIVSLILLTLTTLTGLTAMQVSLLQERMASNTREHALALEAAESALRAAERRLAEQAFSEAAGQGPNHSTAQEPESNAQTHQVVSIPLELARAPIYEIEPLPATTEGSQSLAADEPLAPIHRFRVTATGWGESEHTVLRFQGVYRLE